MKTFILWLFLLFICWPLAIAALILYPVVWILLIPFKIIGITFDALFEFIKAIIFLPAKVLK